EKCVVLVRRLSESPVEEWHRLRTHVLMDAGELGARHLSVTWLVLPAGAEQAMRSHEEGEQAFVVVRGAGPSWVPGNTQAVSGGYLILFPPAPKHSVRNDGDVDFACLSIQSPPVAAAEL